MISVAMNRVPVCRSNRAPRKAPSAGAQKRWVTEGDRNSENPSSHPVRLGETAKTGARSAEKSVTHPRKIGHPSVTRMVTHGNAGLRPKADRGAEGVKRVTEGDRWVTENFGNRAPRKAPSAGAQKQRVTEGDRNSSRVLLGNLGNDTTGTPQRPLYRETPAEKSVTFGHPEVIR